LLETFDENLTGFKVSAGNSIECREAAIVPHAGIEPAIRARAEEPIVLPFQLRWKSCFRNRHEYILLWGYIRPS
jgi:hypothetical protein